MSLETYNLINGVLNGPDIRRLMKTLSFDAELTGYDLCRMECNKRGYTWVFWQKSFQHLENGYVTEMLNAFEELGANMSLKILFLHYHLEYFERQLFTESDEQGERYHQVSLPVEIRYTGKKTADAVLAEICWWSKTIVKENDENSGNGEIFDAIDMDIDESSDLSDF